MTRLKITFYFVLAGVLFNACRKEYSLEGGNLKVPAGTWEFKDSLKQYIGIMDTAYIVSTPGTATKELHLIGTSADGLQTFHMHLFADAFTTGAYKASLFQSSFEYSIPSKTLYQADELVGEFIVNITSFSNNSISGTFSGTADNSTNKTNLSDGKFTSKIGSGGTTGGVSSGVLGDSSGNCKPVTLAGAYVQGVALTSLNTAQVQVVVATAGTYTITTNLVNGVSFSKSGTFASTGSQTVVLNGTGTPSASGSQTFTVSYGNSQCAFKVNYDLPASGTLGGGGSDCTPVTPAGVYTQNIALTAANTIQLQVNVTTPGGYTISTNTVNGVSFTNAGTFTVTGVQNVVLTGSGTPVNSGPQTFAVNFGTSVCNFNITFLPNAVVSNDYLPLTINSNWTYNDASTSSTFYSSVIDHSGVFGGNTYSTVGVYDSPGSAPLDSLYYRKPGGDYYQYVDYADILPIDASVEGEFIFLKDNVAAGTSWSSPTINATAGTVPISFYITMTILEKAVPATVGAFNFPDVIKVRYEYFVTGDPTPLETDERWFAKNTGEIHNSASISGAVFSSYDVGDYHIF